jgi:hypothetical protein
MIPHNIAECQWLIAVINRPFLLAQRRAKNSQRMQDKSKNQQKILFTHKKVDKIWQKGCKKSHSQNTAK